VGAVTEVVVVVATALVLSLLIKTFLIQAFSIPSESMEDTLLIGDRVLVSKLTPGPGHLQRGDVVVFTDPGGWLNGAEVEARNNRLIALLMFVGLVPENYGEHLIKRVVGLPGDTVACCDAEGRITVNGTAVTEPYLRTGNVPSEQTFTVTVKPDNLWVMGDNRSQSSDSRSHLYINDGQIPLEDVVGKAVLVAWPVRRFGSVPDHHEVFAKVPTSK
jgi:signal peptidase I